MPYCEREKGVGGGDKRRDVCFVVPCANLDNCSLANNLTGGLQSLQSATCAVQKNVAYLFGLSKVRTFRQFVRLSIVRA